MIHPLQQRLDASKRFLAGSVQLPRRLGLVLGSGLGEFAEMLPERHSIATSTIPHYPVASVEGHKGSLVFATLHGIPLVAFQGRVHFYETGDIETVLYPVHLARQLGVEYFIVTNAAGGVNRNYQPGDLMVIGDQINLTGLKHTVLPPEPRGEHQQIFDPDLLELVKAAAERERIRLHQGTYAGVKGPSYETAAEVEMIHRIGGDAVGMSTVMETSLAALLGMRVLGISCITNPATGITSRKLSHDEVTQAGMLVSEKFARLLDAVIRDLSEGKGNSGFKPIK